jgi:3-phosphoshikimate 1-carboxyvinyltransferase
LDAFSFDARNAPDGALALATIASKCEGASRLTGLRTLRVKETDRIAALANELRKVGCTVATGEDWIEITPPAAQQPAHSPPHAAGSMNQPIIIETYNDHRMAMAFAVLGLNPPNGVPLAIRNPKCVAKSYPGFWKDFAKLYQ